MLIANWKNHVFFGLLMNTLEILVSGVCNALVLFYQVLFAMTCVLCMLDCSWHIVIRWIAFFNTSINNLVAQ